MKLSLSELLDAYGGVVDGAQLTHSVRHELEMYSLLAGINPTAVPASGGGLGVTPPSRFAQIHFVRRWTVNAVTALTKEVPVLLVFAGTPFALDIYFQWLLSRQDILTELDSAGERSDDATISLDFDYEGLFTGKYPDEIPLTSADVPKEWELPPSAKYFVDWTHYLPRKPRTERRSRLAMHLQSIATFFLMAHELEHVDGGHLEYLDRTFGAASLVEFGAQSADRGAKQIDAITLHALEFLADRPAVLKTFSYAISDTHLLKGSIDEKFRSSLNPTERLRLWLFALMALYCLFEARTKSVRRVPKWLPFPRSTSTHPSAYARLITAVTHIKSLMKDRLSSVETTFELMWDATIKDMVAVLRCLGTEASFNQFRSSSPADEMAKIFERIGDLKPELETAKSAIAAEYYYRGQRASGKATFGA